MRTRQRMARVGCALVMAALSSVALTEAQSTDAAKASGGPQEGIKVHGRWTITVRNEDGSVASRHDFANRFLPQAAAPFAKVLAHQTTLGGWEIGMTAQDPGGANVRVILVGEPSLGTAAGTRITTLQVLAPQAGLDAGALILTGSMPRFQSAAEIFRVNTSYGECPATTTPANPCTPFFIRGFTQHDLITLVTVAQGQSLDVTVKITFS
jgi:hypothetical protein